MKYQGNTFNVDFRAFHEAASNKEHRYGELLDKEEIYYRELLDQIESDHFLEGLTRFLQSLSTNFESPENVARFVILKETGAKQGENFSTDGVDAFSEPEERFEVVKTAVERGFIWDFKLDVPWHPELFKNSDRLTTFPYQHKFMVGYSAKPKHIFFSEEAKEYILEKSSIDEFYNSESIVEQGRLRANRKDYEDSNETLDQAIYFSNLIGTRNYPVSPHGAGVGEKVGEAVYRENVVLEIEVPSNFVVQFSTPDNRWEDIQDLKEDFGSPEAYRQEMDKYNGKSDKMDFKIAKKEDQGSGEVFLPLKYIVAVWDREISSETPLFIPFDDYVSKLQKKYPKRVPGSHNSEIEYEESEITKIKEEFANIRQFREYSHQRIDRMIEYLKNFRKLRESEVDSKQDVIRTLENILKGNQEWNQYLEYITSLCKSSMKLNSEIDRGKVSVWELFQDRDSEHDLEQEMQRLDEIISRLMVEEKQRLDEIKSRGTENLEEEVKNLERKTLQEIQKIPKLNVEERDRKKFKDYILEKYNITEDLG